MNKKLVAISIGCVLAGLAGLAMGNSGVKDEAPAMMASPQTIVLSKVSEITVHTNIPASSVDRTTVTLNDADATAVWADDCGHLAARFNVVDLALEPGEAVTLTLDGDCGEGGTFSVDDVVRVK